MLCVIPSQPCPPADFQPKMLPSPILTVSILIRYLLSLCFWPELIFSLHYQFLRGKPLAFWRDSECRFFLGTVLLLIVICDVESLWNGIRNHGPGSPVWCIPGGFHYYHHGFMFTADYELWPSMSQIILFLCMFLGASAGSTGGGMKCLRVHALS